MWVWGNNNIIAFLTAGLRKKSSIPLLKRWSQENFSQRPPNSVLSNLAKRRMPRPVARSYVPSFTRTQLRAHIQIGAGSFHVAGCAGDTRPSSGRAVNLGVFSQLNLPCTTGESNTVICITLITEVSCWRKGGSIP